MVEDTEEVVVAGAVVDSEAVVAGLGDLAAVVQEAAGLAVAGSQRGINDSGKED